MKDEDTESYDLSISDLMSALCCVFLLFLCVVSIQLNRQRAEYAKKNALAEQYAAMQASPQYSFNKEFTDLDKWNVDITPDLKNLLLWSQRRLKWRVHWQGQRKPYGRI